MPDKESLDLALFGNRCSLGGGAMPGFASFHFFVFEKRRFVVKKINPSYEVNSVAF